MGTGCIACGSKTEITYAGGMSGQESNPVKRCLATGAYGVGCMHCGHVWHSAIKPWDGYAFQCPNCGGEVVRM